MIIQERFGANVIAAANLSPALVPGLATTDTGPIHSNADLNQIAQSVSVNLAAATTTASHARPTMLAYASSFARNVNDALNALAAGMNSAAWSQLDPQVKQDFAQWQGMTAAVALRTIFSSTGLELSVQAMRLEAANSAAEKCILMDMAKDPSYRDAVTMSPPGTPQSGFLFYICQKGQPFAIFHCNVGLVPMQNYAAELFDGILPWYSFLKTTVPGASCHDGWEFVAEPFQDAILDSACLARIALWASKNGITSYYTYLNNKVTTPIPGDDMWAKDMLVGADMIDTITNWGINQKGNHLGSSMAFCTDASNNPITLPKMFLDTMMVSSMGQGNLMKYNSPTEEKEVAFADSPAALEGYAPVPPFTSDMMTLIERNPIQSMCFLPTVVGKGIEKIEIQVTICNKKQESFTVCKTYDKQQLRQGRIPYLMLWPYIDLPANMNLWTQFYATWQNQLTPMRPLLDSDGTIIPMVSDLTFDFNGQGITRQENRTTAKTPAWSVCHSSTPFQYAKLLERESRATFGIVMLPKYHTYSTASQDVINAKNITVAVDFGTTSTVCALNLGTSTITLPFQDYSRAVTCVDSGAKTQIEEGRWLGMIPNGSIPKIFSVAQLFDRVGEATLDRSKLGVAAQQEYYEDARLFLISNQAMVNYATFAQGSPNPLGSQQIMNDMKFNDQLDVRNYQAGTAFLSGIYIHTVLYLLSKRIIPSAKDPYFVMRSSYPNDVTLDALKNNWNNSSTILGKMMENRLLEPISEMLKHPLQHFYSEAAATMAYLRRPESPLANNPKLVSVDIGGGTTDISITDMDKAGDVRHVSLRYAGRDMMVSTLISYFRKFSSMAVVDQEGMFQSLWSKDSVQIQAQFMQLCSKATTPTEREILTSNASVRMIIELLLGSGMNMQPIAIDMQTKLLRQLIAVKLIMSMKMIARSVRDNIDMWYAPNSTTISTIANRMQIYFSVSGTSAQLLQYVFDCNIAELHNVSKASSEGKISKGISLFNEMFQDNLGDLLPEGVTVDIHIDVDPTVAQKREVAYGLLDHYTDDSHKFAVDAHNAGGKGEDSKAAATQKLTEEQRTKLTEQLGIKIRNYDDSILEEYIMGSHGLAYYMKKYESIFFNGAIKADLGLGSVHNISDLLPLYINCVPTAKVAVSLRYAKYMIEPEQANYQDLLACTYMTEEIINRIMAALQSN